MRKRTTLLAVIACFCCLITACAALGANADMLQYELFDFDKAYATTNAAVPESTGITVKDRGLDITASESGASVTLKNVMGGLFDISFLPYSSTGFGGSTIEGGSFDNSYQDIAEMSLVFTDASDSSKSFKVRLTGGADGNNVTVNASVDTGNYRAGVYYYRDNEACGSTSGYNSSSVYTYLYGTSFSNLAVNAGSYDASNVRPIRIIFDPDEMKVYGYNYGYNAYSAEKRLIWDMSVNESDGKNVGYVAPRISEYKVSLVFDTVNSGRTASAIIYSINGQSLASSAVINGAGPECFVDNVPVAEKGTAYTLPVPAAYDVIDGKIDFVGEVKITAPDGSAVVPTTAANQELRASSDGYYVWQSGAKISVAMDGIYHVCYKAKDSDGIFGNEYVAELKVGAESDGLIITGQYESYVKTGSNLSVPSAKWVVDGRDVSATAVVVGPDGRSISSPYRADTAGRYVVKYSATVSGTSLESNLHLYAFDDNSTLFNTSNGVGVSSGVSGLHTGLKGLIASTTVANGTITYNTPIDIKSKTKDETLISFMALPTRIGSASMGQLAVKLTDSADESNYITILITPATDEDMSMVRAGSADQTPSGLSGNGSVESYVGGGTKVFHSFYGVANYIDITEQYIDVRMDYATKCIYIGEKLVCDLDDSEYFSKAWEGFSGNAIISVTMRELAAESASILIDKVDGNKIYGNYYGDCVSPTISAEFDVSDVPDAEVGKNYPILPVTVRDNHDADAAVEIVVTDRNGNVVEHNDNGFIPTAVGEYYMSFTATDRAGNSVTAKYAINSYDSVAAPSITIDGDVPENAFVGEKISLPSYTVSGGSGLNGVSISAVGSKGNTYSVDTEELSFIALVADTYTVTYTVTDYLGSTARATDAITVTVNPLPVWTEKPVMPEVMISGMSITLPTAAAYDYVANRAATVSTRIIVDGQSTQLGADMQYVPNCSAAKTDAKVVYTATAASGKTSSLEYNVILVSLVDDEDQLVISRYFKTNSDVVVTQEEDYIAFGFDSGATPSIEFVKSIYSHGFELTFDVPAGANNFDSITLTLSDGENPSKKVVFVVKKGGFADKTSSVSINGLQDITIEGNFFESVKMMRLAYDNTDYSIKDSSGLTVGYIKYYSDGTRFTGFSDIVNFELTAENVTGVGQINFYKIGNQLLMENDGDYTSPVIVTEHEIERSVSKGGQLIVPSAKAFDVLGFSTSISVSVSKGDLIILSNTSADIAHTLTLNEYGEYAVIYRAYDDNDNIATKTMVVNVRDNVPPEISVEKEEIIVYLGTEVTLPVATITDDVQVDKQYVFIIDTANNMLNVTGETVYKPDKKGIYTIRYVAIDSSGNYGIKDVVLKVAEVKNEEIA